MTRQTDLKIDGFDFININIQTQLSVLFYIESDAEQETKAPVVKINANNELNSVTNILIVLVV